MRLTDLAAAQFGYYYRCLYVLLRREGWSTNHKRIYWLYCEEGQSIPTKRHAGADLAGIRPGGRQSLAPAIPGRWPLSPSDCSTVGCSES
jgi:hypothetical protein